MLCMENILTASLIDTNILVYANNKDSPFHAICKALVGRAVNGKLKAALSVQNLIELYAVITDKRRVEHPLSPVKANELVIFYKNQPYIQIITPNSQTLDTVTRLLAKYHPKSQSIFDCFLAATMIDNEVYKIYTANSDHFKPFSSITTINPLKD